jgi:transketolase
MYSKNNAIVITKRNILKASYLSKEGHIASSFSVLNILNVLVKNFLFKKKKYLDNFILSKGHASLGFYAILNQENYISDKSFFNFAKFKSQLGGHPKRNEKIFTTASTGSLGHGLPIITGMAFASKNLDKNAKNFFILMGDQECNEGTIWESLLLCNHYMLSNITIIIDRNFSREKDLSLGSLLRKLTDFSHSIYEVNGHDQNKLLHLLNKKNKSSKPKIIIANTIKGFGSKIIEEDNSWHHRYPKNKFELDKILKTVKY